MNFEVFGDEDDPDLLWVMGWGNQTDSRHERWFVDGLVDAGFRVHTAEVPTNGTDFDADYLAPVREYRRGFGDHRLVGHSTGGLVVAHLAPDVPAVYLSPWWGLGEETPAVAHLLLRLPVSTPFVPATVEPSVLGDIATEADLTAPDRISPAWMRTMQRAHAELPPLKPSDAVFYCPDDRVVSPRAIEDHAREEQLHTYDGGHEFFACEDREAIFERVLAAISDGD